MGDELIGLSRGVLLAEDTGSRTIQGPSPPQVVGVHAARGGKVQGEISH